MNQNMLTVSQLNRYVKSLLEKILCSRKFTSRGSLNFVPLEIWALLFHPQGPGCGGECVMFKGNAQFCASPRRTAFGAGAGLGFPLLAGRQFPALCHRHAAGGDWRPGLGL